MVIKLWVIILVITNICRCVCVCGIVTLRRDTCAYLYIYVIYNILHIYIIYYVCICKMYYTYIPRRKSVTEAYVYISYRWLLRGTAADDRRRVSGVCEGCRENSWGTVHGTDCVHVSNCGRCWRLHPARGRRKRHLWRFRSIDDHICSWWLHAPARHATITGHADQEQEIVGKSW